MQVYASRGPSESTQLLALEGVGLQHHAKALCRLDLDQFLSLQMQDYDKYGVHSAEDKQKLFRAIKASNQEKIRALAEFNGDNRMDARNSKQPMRRHSTANGSSRTSLLPQTNAAEKGLANMQLQETNEPPKIRVIVRKRPLNVKEIEANEDDTVEVDMSVGRVIVNEPRLKVDLTKFTERHAFTFDGCLNENVSNDDVYKITVQPLVTTIFRQGKATCFAYGQTGSGKTYTMQPLPLRAAADIFTLLADPKYSNLQLWISCFEIYSGKLYDLLNNRKRLEAREDGKKMVQVVGLKEIVADTVPQIRELLEISRLGRSTGCTGANADSSRSHCILQFTLKQSQQIGRRGEESTTIVGKISFIDLAGSERGADTSDSNRTTRMEGAEINKSLLALKECIRALDNAARHVPFRGSKLTEVLRDSFTGDEARTVMIANVSPNSSSCEHTLNTLRYADRVKELKKGRVSGSAPPVDICMKSKVIVQKGRMRAISEASEFSVSPNPLPAGIHISSPELSSRGGLLSEEAHTPEDWLVSGPNSYDQLPHIPRSESPEPPSTYRERLANEAGVGSTAPVPKKAQSPLKGDSLAGPSANGHTSEGYAAALVDWENDFIAEHRRHIEETMRLVRQEMGVLSQVDQSDDAALEYADRLSEILQEKAAMTASLQKRLASFQRVLRQAY